MKKIILLILTCSLLFTACESESKITPETTTAATQPEPQPFPLIVNEVEITAPPQTVVSLSPALGEILYEMGYGELIVGRSSYCNFPEEILSTTELGSSANPNIDGIIALKPDIVLTSTAIAAKDVFNMEQAGIKTVLIPSPTTLDEFSAVYKAIGLIFEGLFVGTDTGEAAYSPITKTLANPSAVDFGTFVYITEGLSAAGGNTLESAVLSCFGENLAKDADGYSFDVAALAENQPNIILLNNNYSLEALQENEAFMGLDAVTSGRVLLCDNSFFERPTARIIEMLAALCDEYAKLEQ